MPYHIRRPSWSHQSLPSTSQSVDNIQPLIDEAQHGGQDHVAQLSGPPSYAPSVDTWDFYNDPREATLPCASENHTRPVSAWTDSTRVESKHNSLPSKKGTAAPSVVDHDVNTGELSYSNPIVLLSSAECHKDKMKSSQRRGEGSSDVSKTGSIHTLIRGLFCTCLTSVHGFGPSHGRSTLFFS
jgi:hypothetical protein